MYKKYGGFRFLLVVVALFSVVSLAFAFQWNTGHRLDCTGTNRIQQIFPGDSFGNASAGICYEVENNHLARDYFLPTKTSGEWDSFRIVAPSLNIDIRSCCTSNCFGKVCGDDGCGGSCGSCGSGESCSNGVCVLSCTSNHHKGCYSGDVYWYNSCGAREGKVQECGTSGYSGNSYCYGGNVYRNYITRSCSGSSCTSSTGSLKTQNCSSGCSGGSCVSCTSNHHKGCYASDVYWYNSCGSRQGKAQECGTSGYSGGNYCYNGNVYRDYITRGCSGSSCTSSTSRTNIQNCGSGYSCSGGSCVRVTCSSGYYLYQTPFGPTCMQCPSNRCSLGSCQYSGLPPGCSGPSCDYREYTCVSRSSPSGCSGGYTDWQYVGRCSYGSCCN